MFLKGEEAEALCRANAVCYGNLQSTRQQAEGVNGGTAGPGRFDHSSWKRSQAKRRSQVLRREGRQLLWFWRGALILGVSTVCWRIVLAEGDTGLGFSKGGGAEPCGSLRSGCYHAWAQEPEACAPAQGTFPSAWLVPTHVSSLQEEATASRAQREVNAASQRDVLPCSCWCLL